MEPHRTLADWVNEVMLDYGVSEAERQRLLKHVDRLPQESRLAKILESDKSHKYKLGCLDGFFLNWKDAGTLPLEFLPLAEVIQRKAKEVGLE